MTDIRLLFTADLHIGRSLHGTSLLSDQRFILESILAMAREHKVSYLLVGGDLFDRAVPSAEAVALADWFFQECVSGLGIQVLVIAGNHDSPERLDFAAGLLARQGLHIIGSFPETPQPIRIETGGTPLELWPLPYAEPATIHHRLDQRGVGGSSGDPGNHQQAWDRLLTWLSASWGDAPACRIMIGHLFTMGGSESESERPLSIGGAQAVSSDTFDSFDLVLLGHLHRAQELKPRLHYAGSPLSYSASEAGQDKSLLLVTIRQASQAKPKKTISDPGPDLFGDPSPSLPPSQEKASIATRRIPLMPKRPVRRIAGFLAELLEGTSEDYLFVSLRDPLPVVDAFARLQPRYPHLLYVDREINWQAIDGTSPEATERRRRAIEAGDSELITTFIHDMTGQDAPPEWTTWINTVLEAQRLALGEAGDA